MEIISSRRNGADDHVISFKNAICELKKAPEVGLDKITNKRQLLFKDLYDIYTSPTERMSRKKENWKRFIQYCRENKIPKSDIGKHVETFKKDKRFIKERTISNFCSYFGHCKEVDLAHLLSSAKDREHCGLNVSGWLLSSVSVARKYDA